MGKVVSISVNLQQTAGSPVGSLAYVIEEQALLVKVNSGWQYVLVSIHSFSIFGFKFMYLYAKIFLFFILFELANCQTAHGNIWLSKNYIIYKLH